MRDALLPLFPLEAVLLPAAALPLHIFEDRYKQMIAAAITENSEFGIVLAGEKGILNVGCTARVDQVVRRYDDGRLDILTVGQRRFEIMVLDQEKDYLRASVSFFDDEDVGSAPLDLRITAIAALKVLKESMGDEGIEIPEHTDNRLSFKVARYVPELPFRQTLLSLRSETQRLKQIAEFLPDYIARARRVAHVRRVAPLNGHGSKDKGLPEEE